MPFDREYRRLPGEQIFLRVWSPQFTNLDQQIPVEAALEKIPLFAGTPINRGDHKPAESSRQHITFNLPVFSSGQDAGERIYALPPDVLLEPQTEYKISGWIQDQKKTIRLFNFPFHTGGNGRPAAF